MRLVHWLFLISAALFVSGIGFLVASARTAQQTPDIEPPVEARVATPVASVKQIMQGIVAPAATAVFSSVGTIVRTSGIEERAPKTDQEWEAVGNNAAALVESGNLLMMGDRAVDTGDWTKISRALIDAGTVALKAIEAKNAEALLASGEAINESCDNCHEKYQRSDGAP
jgi:hypothetical protein